jgi:hypothetical protein
MLRTDLSTTGLTKTVQPSAHLYLRYPGLSGHLYLPSRTGVPPVFAARTVRQGAGRTGWLRQGEDFHK